MNPEERQLLERIARLAEDNNQHLKKIQARARRATIYGFIKLALILIPLIAGYWFLEPYVAQTVDNYNSVVDVFKGL